MNKTINTLVISCCLATLIGSSAVAMRPIPQKELEQLSALMKENVDNDLLFNTQGIQYYLGSHQEELNDPEIQEATLEKFRKSLIFIFNFQIHSNAQIFEELMDKTRKYLDQSTEFYTPEAIAAVKQVINIVLLMR